MKHTVNSQPIHSIPAYKLKGPLIVMCSALALTLTMAACGPQGQDQQGAKPAAKQGAQTSQKAEKMRQSAAKPNHGVAGGAKQGATTDGKPHMGGGTQPLGTAPKGNGMAREQPSPQFQALDTNHDGQITPAEAGSNPKLSKIFKSLDDGDGQLDNVEFSAFKKQKGGDSTAVGAPAGGAEENPNRPK